MRLPEKGMRTASGCIACGQYESACPQHIQMIGDRAAEGLRGGTGAKNIGKTAAFPLFVWEGGGFLHS